MPGGDRARRRKPMMRRGSAFFVLMFFILTLTPGAYALSMSFSDQDYLGGASWGEMTIKKSLPSSSAATKEADSPELQDI